MIHPLADFDPVYRIMEASFPEDERRPYAEQKALLKDPAYRILVWDENTAFIAVWDLGDFAMIEHLAVHPDHRCHGLGSSFLKQCIQRLKKPVCLEVEPPKDAQKILLVEDNSELRIFMYNRLIESYHVIEADDGEEALVKIAENMPDIVVTDLMMPRMNGIELVERIRKDFTISHIPIGMLTARHSPDDRVKAMEYGADGYITKPFDIELLLARIDNLLTQRRKLFEKFSSQSARNKVVELAVGDVVVTDRDEEFMKSIMTWLEENIENSDLTIDQLASHVGLGRTTMYNKIKSLTGKSPVELIKEYRLTKSKLFLKTGQFSVSEVAYKTGFSDPGYFSRCFREQYGMSPAEYLRSHNLKQNHDTKSKNLINESE